jgi:nucleobase:cation symporter-1, NCS1 family
MDSPSLLVVEHYTIQPIRLDQRHGTGSYMFTIWFGCNMNILTVVTGAIATTLFGLSFVAACLALLLGVALGTVFMALHASQGPQLGVPQMVQTRGQFGSIGSVIVIVAVVLMYLGFIASNMVLGGQSVHSAFSGISVNAGVVIVGAISLIATVYGFEIIHEYSKYVSIVTGLALSAIFVSFVFFVGLPKTFLTTGTYTLPHFLGAVSVGALWTLSYAPYVSDYTRYMPKDIGVSPTFWGTYLGTAIGSILPMILGAMLGIVFGAAGLVTGFTHAAGTLALPLVAIFTIGLTCNTAISMYCGVLAVLTLIQTFVTNWIPERTARVVTSLAIFVFAIVIGIKGQANFLANYMSFLYILLYVLVPWTAINLVDYYLIQHGSYDVASFLKSDGGIYGRFQWPAIICYLIGIAIEVPFMSQELYTGPLARKMDGADVSWIVCLLVVGPLYYFVSRRRVPHAFEATVSGESLGPESISA